MSKKTERMNRLIDILKIRSFVSIKELASILNVSEMTVRRDIRLLEANRIADNVDGTAVYNSAHSVARFENEYSLMVEAERQDSQKEIIGKYAADMVEKNDIIILDTGSTTERIVPYLSPNSNITAICYNINILIELRRRVGVEMIFSGGYYHPNTQMFESPEGIQFISRMRAQKVFVSAAGVHEQLGVTCANGYEIPMKQAILRSSLKKILVADSSKFGKLKQAYFCDLTEIDAVVTDSGLSDHWRQLIDTMGIELHIA